MSNVESPAAATELGPDIYCPACQYQLHQAPGDRCPECGHLLEHLRSGECRIPWELRRELGWLRAFWRTVWQVQFRHREFCEAYAGRVSLDEARAFQRMAVTVVMIPLLAVVVLMYAVGPPHDEDVQWTRPQSMLSPLPSSAEALTWALEAVWPVAIMLCLMVVWLFAVTGCPSYFFHPKPVAVRQQNNAVAMSYYACGVLGPGMVVAMGVLLACVAAGGEWGTLPAWQAWPVMTFLLLMTWMPFGLAWWWNLVRTLRRIMPLRPNRAVALAVGLPVIWFALTGLLLVAVPVVMLFVWVVVGSLQTYPPTG